LVIGHCAGAALLAAGCAGQPLYPLSLPPAATAFRAPYGAVWNATLASIGVAPPRFVDPARGRIITDRFSFALPVQTGMGIGGAGIATQVLQVSMDILVRPTPEGLIAVQAQTTVYDALQYGFWPGAGGPNSPEGDLFARIASRLGQP
jgi:hypothetical protein